MTAKSVSGRTQCKIPLNQKWQAQSSEGSFWSSSQIESLQTRGLSHELFFWQNHQNVGPRRQVQTKFCRSYQLGKRVSNILWLTTSSQLFGWSQRQTLGHNKGHHLSYFYRAQNRSSQLQIHSRWHLHCCFCYRRNYKGLGHSFGQTYSTLQCSWQACPQNRLPPSWLSHGLGFCRQ